MDYSGSSSNGDTYIPDRDAFKYFFKYNVPKNCTTISFSNFILHDDIRTLLDQGDLSLSKIKLCWEFYEDWDKEITEEQAYSVFYNLLDLTYSSPPLDERAKEMESQETLFYLQDQFMKLTEQQDTYRLLSFSKFMRWSDVQILLANRLIARNDITAIWMHIIGNVENPIDMEEFLYLYRKLNELSKQGQQKKSTPHVDNPAETQMKDGFAGNVIKPPYRSDSFENYGDEANDYEYYEDLRKIEMKLQTSGRGHPDDPDLSYDQLDIWDNIYDPTIIFQPEFISYLKRYYYSVTNDKVGLSFKNFSEWNDIVELLNERRIDLNCLKTLWSEALKERPYLQQTQHIDYDTFLRVNIRLDNMLNEMYESINYNDDKINEEIDRVLQSYSNQDFEIYHQKEFNILTNGKKILTFAQLLSWENIIELFEQNQLTLNQLEHFWETLPKQVMKKSEYDNGVNCMTTSPSTSTSTYDSAGASSVTPATSKSKKSKEAKKTKRGSASSGRGTNATVTAVAADVMTGDEDLRSSNACSVDADGVNNSGRRSKKGASRRNAGKSKASVASSLEQAERPEEQGRRGPRREEQGRGTEEPLIEGITLETFILLNVSILESSP